MLARTLPDTTAIANIFCTPIDMSIYLASESLSSIDDRTGMTNLIIWSMKWSRFTI